MYYNPSRAEIADAQKMRAHLDALQEQNRALANKVQEALGELALANTRRSALAQQIADLNAEYQNAKLVLVDMVVDRIQRALKAAR